MKRYTKLFFVLTFLLLLFAVSVVSASDDDMGSVDTVTEVIDDTSAMVSTQQSQISDNREADTMNVKRDDENIRRGNVLKATKNVTITPENYGRYVFEGSLLGATKNMKISFQGEFTDKGRIYINTGDLLLDGGNANFTNTYFILDASNITLANMTITNANTTYPVNNLQDNNTIENNTITIVNAKGKTAAIYSKANNTVITFNRLNVTGPAGNIDWEEDNSGICTTQAILSTECENNTITHNLITVNATDTGESFGTMEAITHSRIVANSLIAYNNITVTGGHFNYAVNQLDRVKNSTIMANRILSIGYRYADGIQVGDNATNIVITGNDITCICLNDTPVDEAALTYGIITTCQGGQPSTNFTITHNNLNMTGVVNYGMEIYKTTQTTVSDNIMTLNGQKSMGVGYCHSPNGILENNEIIISDVNITTINSVTEEIQPQTTGIKIQGSSDITINNNTIITADTKKEDTTIDTESMVTITNNQLTSSTQYGIQSIKYNTPPSMANNTVTTITHVDDVNSVINMPTTIKVKVTDTRANKIRYGRVILTDRDDNFIADATLDDGEAVLMVTFTQSMNTTITALFQGQTGLSSSQDQVTLLVMDFLSTTTLLQPVLVNTDGTALLTATVTSIVDVTSGCVYFKADGKILRDATTGKIIYATIGDSTATIIYDAPKTWNEDTKLEAVYMGSGVLTASTSQAVNPTMAESEEEHVLFNVSDATATAGEEVIITVTTKNLDAGKVVLKVNGKTVKAQDGRLYAKTSGETSTFTYTVPKTLKAGDYSIRAVYTSSTLRFDVTGRLVVV